MPISDDAEGTAEALQPNRRVLLCGSAAVALISALIAVLLARRRGQAIERTAKVPFGAFLCPALWLAYYATRLQS
jgi:hypothetical protein